MKIRTNVRAGDGIPKLSGESKENG
jgi:hypothetical protein